MTDDRPYMVLLNSDGWLSVEDYVSSRDYVYVKGYAFMARAPGVGIARRGKYDNSYWWQPDGVALPLSIQWWKPFPEDGVSPHRRWLDFIAPTPGAYVRPPEEIFEPAGTDAKLTPVPRKLLLAMHGGDTLIESAWRWTSWLVERDPGGNVVDKITEGRGGISKLRQLAFIERVGVLPPGKLERWYHFDWKITAAGEAWIEANTGEKR
jgi:hypothetical protein